MATNKLVFNPFTGSFDYVTDPATFSLDDLSDVVITSPATGSFLQYDGANWIDFDLLASNNTWTGTNTFNGVVSIGIKKGLKLIDDDQSTYVTIATSKQSGIPAQATIPILSIGDTFAMIGIGQNWGGINDFTLNFNLMKFNNLGLQVSNPTQTFYTTIQGGAVAANRIINLPIVTATDTFSVLGLAQTYSAAKTFSASLNLVTGSMLFDFDALQVASSGTAGAEYTITGTNITADRTLNLPLITGTDTLASLGLAQTFSAAITFSVNPTFTGVSTTRIPFTTTSGLITSSANLTYAASGFGFDTIYAQACTSSIATITGVIGVQGVFTSSLGAAEANREGFYDLATLAVICTYEPGTTTVRLNANSVSISAAGAVTAATYDSGNGAVELYPSGTYTPTLTNGTNVAASTAYQCQYFRVGNVVTVSGKVDIDPTAAGALELGMSLPIASNFGNDFECAGTAASIAALEDPPYVKGDAANNRASFNDTAVSTANQSYFFTFTYLVI